MHGPQQANPSIQQQPAISIIIASFNTRDFLAACLASLASSIGDSDIEVVVADNASTDGSLEMVKSDFPWVRTCALEVNMGFSGANNAGIRAAAGRLIMLLNSDTVVLEGALQQIILFMGENPDIGVCGPQLLNPDGTVQLSCRRFPSYKTALFHRYSVLTRLFPRNRFSQAYLMTDKGHSTTMDVDWVSGAALVVRREVLDRVGLLDEDFFMYAEDVDLCYRIKQAGWRIVYLPESKIVHHIGQSTRKVPIQMTYQRHRSMWRFYKKHYSKGITLVDVATWVGIAARCLIMITRNALKALLRSEVRS